MLPHDNELGQGSRAGLQAQGANTGGQARRFKQEIGAGRALAYYVAEAAGRLVSQCGRGLRQAGQHEHKALVGRIWVRAPWGGRAPVDARLE